MQRNDVVILGSDGVFDNLFDKDIIDCIKPYDLTKELKPEDLKTASVCVAEKAETLSYDKNYKSPFYENGLKHNRVRLGGKDDDITLIVAQIDIN